MQKFYNTIVRNPKKIIITFVILVIISLLCKSLVAVNYNMNDYLPEGSPSTAALDVMADEFGGGIPNARVMIKDVTIPQALNYKEKLSKIDGVSEVTWLDDVVDITVPIRTQTIDTIEKYYKNNAALYTITIDEDKLIKAITEIRSLIGESNSMTGAAVSTAVAMQSTAKDISKIAIFAILFALFVLTLTTTSWFEPIIVISGIGVAVIINAGTNLIFGEISFLTNAAGSILQLAVSLDYSVFLIHRFAECRRDLPPKEAMVEALCKSTSSILSSGLTTVIGFLALTLMQFRIGLDLGLALGKGICISLLVVFVFMPPYILFTYKLLDKTEHKPLLPSFSRFGRFVTKIMIPMVVIFVVLIVPTFLASNKNSFYYGASHIFNKTTQLGSDTAKIEDVFGKNDTYVLLVPKGGTATEIKLSYDLKDIPSIKSIISYVNNVGAEIPPEYLDSKTYTKLESKHYSRMVLSVDAEYEGKETFSLIEKIRNTANKYYSDKYYLAGEGVNTYDLMKTVTSDMLKVNLIAIGAVFIVLLLTMKSISLPVILVLGIETAVWINFTIPYFTDKPLFYIAYLIISSVQLGATVDYAILFTERYKEFRETKYKKQAVIQTISTVSLSILTSGSLLTVVGFLLGSISKHGMLSQLGFFLGKGTLCSMAIVFLVLPGLLYIFDGFISKTTKGIVFLQNHKEV